MIHENQWLNALGYGDGLMTWREKETIKGDRYESAKDPPTIKSVFSLEHKDGGFVNSRTYLGWMRLDPFIES